MSTANPESAAEGLVRLAGAGLAVVGILSLRGLYLLNEPSNWLSNLGVSVGDNDFRTLSGVAIVGTAIGAGLYLRKGLWIIIAAGLISLAYFGHKYEWYSLNNKTTETVQHSAMSKPGTTSATSSGKNTTDTWRGKQYTLTDTRVKMTKAHLAWCWKDDNGNDKKEPQDSDGIQNNKNSALAVANCSTGYIHSNP